jgi:elongation factor G
MMKQYAIHELRNIGIIAHGGAGKTSLAEAMLYDAGSLTRLGRVDDGTASMDYDPDEIKRKISISSAINFAEWNKHKINIVDTPGYANFIADTKACLRAVDAAVVIVSAISGVKVQTEKVWRFAHDYELPRLIFVNKMDRERANFMRALGDIEKALGITPLPLQLPIGAEHNFKGVVDLLSQKAYVYKPDGSGKFEVQDIPADLRAEADKYREKLIEAIVETNDELLTTYLEGGELKGQQLEEALREATITSQFVPVVYGSAIQNIGIQPLLDAMVNYLPSPADRPVPQGVGRQGKPEKRRPEAKEPFSAQVFKTVVDQHVGKLSLFRVFSGELNADSVIYNSAQDTKERVGHIYILQGKQQKAVNSVKAGEIAAVAKLKVTRTGDTLCDEKSPIIFEPLAPPKPVLSFAIEPKSKGDEEKVSLALQRLSEEDPSLEVRRDDETRELLVSGMGQVHLEVIVDRLRRKFGVEVHMKSPKVPYKETIRSSAKAQGKYKKQSGGRGQYGDTWLELEPLPRGQGFEFVDKIVGGVIPRQYIPAVEKGVVEAMEGGVIAGYPVVDVKVTLYDGSFHSVDSSEMAFKIAASMGFKKAVLEAEPVLLEPIMNMEVTVPDECMGDVIGDLNARRGKVLGVEPRANSQNIKAQVPMAEVLKYAPNLRSMTGGRGVFSMEFSHYEEVPSHLSEKIIEQAKANKEEKK